MATETASHGTLTITSIAADWDYKTSKPSSWPDVPRIASIQFTPGAADDKITVKEQGDTGPTVFYVICENAYDQRIKYFHGTRIIPFIDFGDCTLSTGHSVTIELWRDA